MTVILFHTQTEQKTRGPRGLKSLTWETCLACSFAQNFINYMPIIWMI